MTRAIFQAALVLLVLSAGTALAQVRPVQSSPADEPERAVPKELPDSVDVEYQGGIYGYSDKEKGAIRFDDINERLVFYGEDGKEKFSIPYDAILVVYPSQKKVRSGTGRAVGMIPVPGAAIGGMFMKKKKNYLIIQYSDPEVNVEGTANFLIDTGDLLFSAIHAVGQKAEMQRRGDAYIRKRTI
jgi:hypothetical protein